VDKTLARVLVELDIMDSLPTEIELMLGEFKVMKLLDYW
jgi:hypothetical protein